MTISQHAAFLIALSALAPFASAAETAQLKDSRSGEIVGLSYDGQTQSVQWTFPKTSQVSVDVSFNADPMATCKSVQAIVDSPSSANRQNALMRLGAHPKLSQVVATVKWKALESAPKGPRFKAAAEQLVQSRGWDIKTDLNLESMSLAVNRVEAKMSELSLAKKLTRDIENVLIEKINHSTENGEALSEAGAQLELKALDIACDLLNGNLSLSLESELTSPPVSELKEIIRSDEIDSIARLAAEILQGNLLVSLQRLAPAERLVLLGATLERSITEASKTRLSPSQTLLVAHAILDIENSRARAWGPEQSQNLWKKLNVKLAAGTKSTLVTTLNKTSKE